MNGKDSSNKFFKDFPKVHTKSYQGSLTSDSKGILKVFKKARNSLNNEEFSKNNVSVIYFDEMGLAEISKNNPLKVIHSQLEYDENEKKVAFIGISNWPFDASKMNRGICLSIPEPDKEDLKETAKSISESYDTRLIQKYNELFKYLSYTYYHYKILLKDNPFIFENTTENKNKFESNKNNIKEFHGTRDFYHLIKTFSKMLLSNKCPENQNKLEKIIYKSIERNFGGLDFSIIKFKELLKQKYLPIIHDINHYNVMKCIVNNIQDPKSRYLLIETKGSISQYLITLILEKMNRNFVFYYGSNFEDDTIKKYYSAKILNKIQVTMNEDNVMILKNLTSMYPSLYDLFNQNFRKVGETYYARIALGNSNPQNCPVNPNFRLIVLLDRNEIDKQDPPFINRFEKHIITFKDLLTEKQIEFSNQIYNIIHNIFNNENKLNKIDLQSELLN
eukprot:jgi/Orpsp1_1/1185480/evm.model.c7180000093977.1